MDLDAKYERRTSAPIRITTDRLVAIAAEISPSPLTGAEPLSGGFSNHNLVLTFDDGERCVLRLSTDEPRLRMEADLLGFLGRRAPAFPVPEVLWRSSQTHHGPSAIALTYVDGAPLAVAEDHFGTAQRQAICERLGAVAAAIHAVTFDQAGMLGPGPVVSQPFESYRVGALAFLAEALDVPILQRRIGRDRHGRLRQCLDLPDDITAPSTDGQLCHGDFNQKNVLVRIGPANSIEIAAILDWEFAMSGAGVLDLGNLLRFEAESPSVDAARFAAAYRAAGGHLDNNWQQQSLFADLLAQAEFLTGENHRPKTFATAITVIDRSLAELGL